MMILEIMIYHSDFLYYYNLVVRSWHLWPLIEDISLTEASAYEEDIYVVVC